MEFLQQLNQVQRKAVSALEGPVMIVAGAGSGKTRVLTYRVANLIHKKVPPAQILALTFTNKAASEMKERIQGLVGDLATQIWAGTFHSTFAKILRFECQPLGYGRAFSIYDTDDGVNLIKNIMGSLNISTQQFSPKAILSKISGAKNQLISCDKYEEIAHDPYEKAAAAVFREYIDHLSRNNAMDFDDLLLKPIELFQRYPEVLEKYQHRFKYILIDEYQDTNRAQYVLIRMLAEKFRNICVVGDDAQSIYAFRGADIRNILDFERDYPNCAVYRLEQNYRSTKKILATAASVLRHNTKQIPKTLWTDNPDGEQVIVIEAIDDRDEGSKIVQKIQETCSRLKLDLKDVAVLYRTNAQSRSIEDNLRRSGVSYVIVGGVEFYKRKEIKDILAYLRLIINPRDNEALLRVINTPARGIGETTVKRILGGKRIPTDEHQQSMFDRLRTVRSIDGISERTKLAVEGFVGLLGKYISLRPQMSVSELAHALVDELGVLRQYKEEATPESLARWENVQELLSAIAEFTASTPDATLEDFLGEVALLSPVDEEIDQRNAVTLMTLHAAKGLEFPMVCITGLEEGLLPFYQSSPEPDEVEEERRLCYVGMTRAMTVLCLSYARTRYRSGEITYPTVSRFLEEINQSLLQREESLGWIGRQRPRTAHTPLTLYSGSPAKPRRSEISHHEEIEQHHKYEDESQEEVILRVGMIVVHEIFGRGKIIQLAGRGETAKGVVLFDSVGSKNLMLKYAHLRCED